MAKYKVRAGDTIQNIAREHDMSARELADLNGSDLIDFHITDGDEISVLPPLNPNALTHAVREVDAQPKKHVADERSIDVRLTLFTHEMTGDNVALKAMLDWVWRRRKAITVHTIVYNNYFQDDKTYETFEVYHES